jgi:hypothetical protein
LKGDFIEAKNEVRQQSKNLEEEFPGPQSPDKSKRRSLRLGLWFHGSPQLP